MLPSAKYRMKVDLEVASRFLSDPFGAIRRVHVALVTPVRPETITAPLPSARKLKSSTYSFNNVTTVPLAALRSTGRHKELQ